MARTDTFVLVLKIIDESVIIKWILRTLFLQTKKVYEMHKCLCLHDYRNHIPTWLSMLRCAGHIVTSGSSIHFDGRRHSDIEKRYIRYEDSMVLDQTLPHLSVDHVLEIGHYIIFRFLLFLVISLPRAMLKQPSGMVCTDALGIISLPINSKFLNMFQEWTYTRP